MGMRSDDRCLLRTGRRLSAGGAVLALSLLAACANSGSAPAPDASPPAPAWDNRWADGAVFYEIFVRSFADSNGDGVGDFAGLTAKLPYLNDGDPATTADLGVDGIWLMPVFESPSYHGYDTVDYDAIDAEYGTLADFEAFLAEAHRRGIKVIVDLMVNHTSDRHPWFVDSAAGPEAAKRDWYVWRRDDPGWVQPWGGRNPTWHERGGEYYYGIFWGGMPDLNFRTPAVREEVKAIAGRWLARGVDGFRLDAARHIVADGPGEDQNDTPETHAWWKEFAAHVRTVAPQALLVGENWTGTGEIAAYYGSDAVVGGDELPMNFNFPLASAIVDAVLAGEARPIAETLAEVASAYPEGALDATFLSNHDMVRLATRLGDDRARLGVATAVLLTLPGTPFLYYGDELGLANGPESVDEDKRTPMPWQAPVAEAPGGGFTTGKPWRPFAPAADAANVAAQTADPRSPLGRTRALIRARHSSPALARGRIEKVEPATVDRPPSVLSFFRVLPGEDGEPGERVLVVHNLGAEPATAGPFPAEFDAGFERIFADPGISLRGGGNVGPLSIDLPPYASGAWRLPLS